MPHHYDAWAGTLYTAKITGLQALTKYRFKVGSESEGWSQVFTFVSPPAAQSKESVGAGQQPPIFKMVVVGDIGFYPESYEMIDNVLQNEFAAPAALDSFASASNTFDRPAMLLHPGDVSYANGNQTIWDIYMNMMQPIASRIPYMISIGNHDIEYMYGPQSFDHRFTFPG